MYATAFVSYLHNIYKAFMYFQDHETGSTAVTIIMQYNFSFENIDISNLHENVMAFTLQQLW